MQTLLRHLILAVAMLLPAMPAARALEATAPYAIIMHAQSGRVIFAKNHNELFPPASMSKIVTAGVVFKKLREGAIKEDDLFTVSENAWRTGGAPAGNSTMFAEVRSQIRVIDLLRGLIIQSGNDAAMVLAEGISGDITAFTKEMKAYAESVGAKDASFVNASGLPEPGQLMSAYDLALVARDLILSYPEYYKIFGEESFEWNGIFQRSRNPLLGKLEGADGLKTGYTRESGYGLVASAERNGVRLIVVVGGLSDAEEREDEAKRLFEWAFENFSARQLATAGTVVANARVLDGTEFSVPLVLPQNLAPLLSRESTETVWGQVFYDGPLTAPIEQGVPVGTLQVYAGNEKIAEEKLLTGAAVARGDIYDRAAGSLAQLFYGMLPKVDLGKLASARQE